MMVLEYHKLPILVALTGKRKLREEPFVIWGGGARAKAGKKNSTATRPGKKNSTQQPGRKKNSTA